MNEREFALFVSAIKTYYPREKIFPNQQSIELWYMHLKDIPYKVAQLALNKWVATNKWSPAISDIRELAREVSMGDIPDWGEGWKQVQLAIRRYGYYNSEEAMNMLEGITKECVERMGFRNICASETPEVERANFRDLYKALAARKVKEDVIPNKLKNLIEQNVFSDNNLLEISEE